MSPFIGEIIGTMILILLGNGVVANLNLKDTFGNGGGWIVVTFAWGFAVYAGVVVSGDASGAHLNPAVTIGLALIGNFAWSAVPMYILAQFIGAGLGMILVWIMYKPHYDTTEDAMAIRSSFCNTPAIENTFSNLMSEVIGTFVLVYGIMHITGATIGGESASLGSIDALPVALIVVVVGMSLGGTTGYAINPARDLGPRIIHAILPIRNKGGNGWNYSWIPVVGPILGAVVAAGVKIYIG